MATVYTSDLILPVDSYYQTFSGSSPVFRFQENHFRQQVQGPEDRPPSGILRKHSRVIPFLRRKTPGTGGAEPVPVIPGEPLGNPFPPAYAE